MREILEQVVANGTGKGAYVNGFRIGGKTGTSEKLPRGSGKYVASFVGFAPADDPQIVCLLMVDEPMAGATGGGAVAAPAVGKIIRDVLPYLGYKAQYTESTQQTISVNVPGQDVPAPKRAGWIDGKFIVRISKAYVTSLNVTDVTTRSNGVEIEYNTFDEDDDYYEEFDDHEDSDKIEDNACKGH